MDWSFILTKCCSFSDDPSALRNDCVGVGVEIMDSVTDHTYLAENVSLPNEVVIRFLLLLCLLALCVNLFGMEARVI